MLPFDWDAELDRTEADVWEAPDALGVSGAEAMAADPATRSALIASARTFWIYGGLPTMLALGWCAGGLMAWITS